MTKQRYKRLITLFGEARRHPGVTQRTLSGTVITTKQVSTAYHGLMNAMFLHRACMDERKANNLRRMAS